MAVYLLSGNYPTPPAQSNIYNAVTTITADYTPLDSDYSIRADATSNTVTVNLPQASLYPGRILQVKRISSANNNVTVDAYGSELIDGFLTKVLSSQNQVMVLQSNGTSWDVLPHYEPTVSRNRTNSAIQSTLTLTTTEQDFGYAMRIPSDAFALGNSIILSIRGTYSTSALALSATTANLKLNGTNVGSATVTALSVSQTNQPFDIDLNLKVSSVTSSTATLTSWGLLRYMAATGSQTVANSAVSPVTISVTSGTDVIASAGGLIAAGALGTTSVQILFYDVQVKRAA